ncbi:MAG TPA: hypothetical protein VE524_06240 [Nitrososphaeraceae archaeon]|nr:hypothetical protein [Nitrososphaeraceae archaeon]
MMLISYWNSPKWHGFPPPIKTDNNQSQQGDIPPHPKIPIGSV